MFWQLGWGNKIKKGQCSCGREGKIFLVLVPSHCLVCLRGHIAFCWKKKNIWWYSIYITLLQRGTPQLRLPQSLVVHTQCTLVPSLELFQSELSMEPAQASVLSSGCPCSCSLLHGARPHAFASHPRGHKTYSSYHSMVQIPATYFKDLWNICISWIAWNP